MSGRERNNERGVERVDDVVDHHQGSMRTNIFGAISD
jgi:hypothetical protein